MAVFSVGAMLSAFLGGFLGDWFARRFGPKGRIILMQVYLLSFAAVVYVTTQVDFGSKGAQYALTFVMGLVFSVGFSGCVLPMVSTVVPRQLSATAFAMLFSLIQGALTAVLSLLMGQLADVLGLGQTFLYVVVLPYLINAVFWFGFYKVYPRDVELQEQRSRELAAAAA
jgi:MFS family permease